MAINNGTGGAIYGKSTSTTMTTEAVTSSAGNVYQITDTAKRIIDPAVTPTANISSGTSVDTTYCDNGWDYFTGKVKLTAPGTGMTITGNYLVMTSWGSIISWSADVAMQTAETTALGDTWKNYTTLDKGTIVTLNRYYLTTDNRFWNYISTSGPTLILQLWENASSGFWIEGAVTSFGVNVRTGAVQEEPVTVQVRSIIGRC